MMGVCHVPLFGGNTASILDVQHLLAKYAV